MNDVVEYLRAYANRECRLDRFEIRRAAYLLAKANAEVSRLLKREEVLDALEAGGVDNWQWYDASLAELRARNEPEVSDD